MRQPSSNPAFLNSSSPIPYLLHVFLIFLASSSVILPSHILSKIRLNTTLFGSFLSNRLFSFKNKHSVKLLYSSDPFLRSSFLLLVLSIRKAYARTGGDCAGSQIKSTDTPPKITELLLICFNLSETKKTNSVPK